MNNLKLIDKYIAKQLIETFLLGIIIFTSIMFASDAFITLIKQISIYGISFKVAILLIILKLPMILTLTIPMGVLLSTVMTVNKLSMNSEITIMRACGVSIARISRPVLLFGMAAMMLCFFINEFVAPAANMQSKNLMVWAINQKTIPDGQQNFTFKEFKSGNILKRLFYVSKSEKKTLYGVTVLDFSKDDQIQVVQSRYGKSIPQNWKFNDGVIYTISKAGNFFNTALFDNLKMNNIAQISDKFNKTKANELNFFELANYLNENKKQINKKLLIELNEKLSIPVTCLVLASTGLPLALTPPRVRFNRGFLFSVLIIFCYYILRSFSISLGEAEVLQPLMAAWLPNIILAIVGGGMFCKKAFFI